MSIDDILAVFFCPLGIAVMYIAGKLDLFEQVREQFINWVDDIVFKNKTKNGLSPETKQAILDDFMKGSDK